MPTTEEQARQRKVDTLEQWAEMKTRKAVLDADPRIQKALAELSGKLSTETMRNLSAQVDVDRRPPNEVAAAFLAGLK